ncbi:hypothetical protein SXCC_02381 [Gluconacetobacter sp. SXCC-1]|nr:hypothetical protein SXCC_02381 [Gluconacetobacter sp. SXCC-1]
MLLPCLSACCPSARMQVGTGRGTQMPWPVPVTGVPAGERGPHRTGSVSGKYKWPVTP